MIEKGQEKDRKKKGRKTMKSISEAPHRSSPGSTFNTKLLYVIPTFFQKPFLSVLI